MARSPTSTELIDEDAPLDPQTLTRRKSPVITGDRPSGGGCKGGGDPADGGHLTGADVQRRQSERSRARRVAHTARATSSTWMKLRRCRPSSKTRVSFTGAG